MDFDDYRDADDAVYDLHRTEFMGEMVSTPLKKMANYFSLGYNTQVSIRRF